MIRDLSGSLEWVSLNLKILINPNVPEMLDLK